MTVTVGIATTGETPFIRQTVERVLRSAARTGPDAEVLVVVNGRDRLDELEKVDSPALRVVYLARRNVARARNAVLEQARNDCVLFTDDDCVVPVEWCTQLRAALRQPDCALVNGPIRIPVRGPVSAYANYQKLLTAKPVDECHTVDLVTANCGIRRDRIPAGARFDEALHSSGEDSDFALRMGAAGHRIGFLADAAPVEHPFSEQIGEITDRHQRYGASSAVLYLRNGWSQAKMPGVVEWYRSMTRPDFAGYRRFGELPEPARTAFTVYDYLMNASTVVGYLDSLGEQLGSRVIELDRAGLRQAWQRIAERVATEVSDVDWPALDVDFRRLPGAPQGPQPILDQVRAALRQYVPVLDTGPRLRLAGDEQRDAAAAHIARLDKVRGVWRRLRGSAAPITPELFNRDLRAAGIPFQVGCALTELLVCLEPEWRRARPAGAMVGCDEPATRVESVGGAR